MRMGFLYSVNPIQDGGQPEGGQQKAPTPPTSFSPVTSINVGTSPKNFLTFNPFDRMV